MRVLLPERDARPAASSPPSSSRACPARRCSNGQGRAAASATPYRDSLASRTTAAGTKHYDPYSFPLEIDDSDLATIRRRQPHPCASVPRRARAHDRRRARHPLRRLGAERRARQRRRHLQSLGRALSPDERARQLRRLGAVHARARRRRALQVRDLHARQPRAQAEDRPVRRGVREPARDREHHRRSPRRSPGTTRRGSSSARSATGSKSRCRSTKCTWARGGATPAGQFLELSRARAAARRVRQGPRLHARGAAADHGAPVRRLVGLSVHGLLRADEPPRLARRAARARRGAAQARASACCSTGCRATSRRTTTRSRASTARRCTSTAIRRRASIPIGTRSCSTTRATRCRAFCCRAPSVGSRTSISTGCASTPSRRCSISTTRASRTNGRRTSTAATRTSRRSRS